MKKKSKYEDVPKEYLSTSRQIAEFIDGITWKDIEHELKEWLTQIVDNLVEEATGDEIHLQRGRAQALKKVLLLPHVMLESMRLEEEVSKELRKDRS